MSGKKRSKYEVRDRFSNLPDSLLLEILSFLPLKQVTRQSILSKRWKHVCSEFPILDFGSDFFSGDDSDFWSDQDNFFLNASHNNQGKILKTQRKMQELFRVVDRMLEALYSQSLSVKKFAIEMPLHDLNWANHLDRWIEHVVVTDGSIEQLTINLCVTDRWILRNVGNDVSRRNYDLPRNIFVSKSIVELELKLCRLQPCVDINLPSLRMLSLNHIKADDHIIQNLIAGCPNLEKLTIVVCDGLRKLQVVDQIQLKELILSWRNKLEFIKIEGLPSLSRVGITSIFDKNIQLTRCENIKSMNISAPINIDWLTDLLAKLPLLEILTLQRCDELKYVTFSSRHLKTLFIYFCRKLERVTFDTPNLRQFHYWGNVIEFSTLSVPSVYLQIERRWTEIYIEGELWYSRHIQLLTQFRQCSNVVYLNLGDQGKTLDFPLNLREATLQPPFSRLKKLHCKINGSGTIGQTIDSLFWICSHPEIISLQIASGAKYQFLFSYNKSIIKGEKFGCCNFFSSSCRRHCIKDIKIEKYQSVGIGCFEKTTFDPTLLQDTEILQKFEQLQIQN